MSNSGNTYTEEFRRDAVELPQSNGRPVSQVTGESFGAGALAEDLLAEIKKLQKENEYLRRQREILKKAASILSEDPAVGYALIEKMRDRYPVMELCDALEVSRSGYYKSLRARISERKKENQQLTDEMKQIHGEGFKRAYGSPRMTVEAPSRIHLLGE